jgi:AmmeMemoRadiSam system protein A
MTQAPGPLDRIDPELRRLLLALARRALEVFLEDGKEVTPPGADSRHEATQGLFVTLRHGGDLRGCIGLLQSTVPLTQLVQECAVAAARDPRFTPLSREELPLTSIEISILGEKRVILEPGDLRLGKEGLLISLEGRRGLLLPQVATERSLDALHFFEETCAKAGLHSNAWRTGATVEAFAAEVFADSAAGSSDA